MKLQQKIAFGLCLFYIVSVVGIAVSMHFCGGKLSSVQFTEAAKCSACKGEKKIEKHNCCKNTEVQAKVDDSHEAGIKVKVPDSSSIDLFLRPMLAEFLKSILPKWFGPAANKAPPLSSVVSLYLYNCVFRN
jgi:hypothetical protein